MAIRVSSETIVLIQTLFNLLVIWLGHWGRVISIIGGLERGFVGCTNIMVQGDSSMLSLGLPWGEEACASQLIRRLIVWWRQELLPQWNVKGSHSLHDLQERELYLWFALQCVYWLGLSLYFFLCLKVLLFLFVLLSFHFNKISLFPVKERGMIY